jgi:hypothetical protein
MVCHRMTMLSEKCTYNIVRGIGLNLEWLFQIEQGEYRSLAQVMIQIIECSLLLPPPHEIFPATALGHLAEGPCNMGESQHELSVEVGQSQEVPKLG